MWQVFQENVDPILKVLHIPTMMKLIRDLRNSLDILTPSTEALMFAVYYAAITSLDEDEVWAVARILSAANSYRSNSTLTPTRASSCSGIALRSSKRWRGQTS